MPGEVLRLPVRIDHGGENVVEIEAEAAAGELTAYNNKAVDHRSRASARSCACCSSPASRTRASAPGATS